MTFPLFLPAVLSVCACGGRNAGELMKRYPAANLTAIDYSPLSVETSKTYNQAMIDAGRMLHDRQ